MVWSRFKSMVTDFQRALSMAHSGPGESPSWRAISRLVLSSYPGLLLCVELVKHSQCVVNIAQVTCAQRFPSVQRRCSVHCRADLLTLPFLTGFSAKFDTMCTQPEGRHHSQDECCFHLAHCL